TEFPRYSRARAQGIGTVFPIFRTKKLEASWMPPPLTFRGMLQADPCSCDGQCGRHDSPSPTSFYCLPAGRASAANEAEHRGRQLRAGRAHLSPMTLVQPLVARAFQGGLIS